MKTVRYRDLEVGQKFSIPGDSRIYWKNKQGLPAAVAPTGGYTVAFGTAHVGPDVECVLIEDEEEAT